MTLGEFLRACTAKARVPGEWDCCAMPAAWAMETGADDPMAAWRGAYSTDDEGERLADEAGGLAVLFDRAFPGIGWQRVEDLQPGDVGVIDVQGLQAGAVYVGPRWAFVATRGLGMANIEPEYVRAAWGRRDHG